MIVDERLGYRVVAKDERVVVFITWMNHIRIKFIIDTGRGWFQNIVQFGNLGPLAILGLKDYHRS